MNNLSKITILGLMGNSAFLRVPHFHSIGETLQASSLYMEPGGKGCNQAVAAARLGARVNFISCMGNDSIARECLEFMSKEHITCFTEYTMAAPSPYACILTDSSGENQVTVHNGSANFLSSSFVERCEEYIASSDILLLNNECPLEANITATEIALHHGVTTVLNPAPFQSLPIEYLSKFKFVTPNRHEAAMLCGLSSDSCIETLMHGLLSLGIQCPIITLGNKGAAFWNKDEIIIYPSVSVVVQDTTGAGDCFNGALCYSIAEGNHIEKTVKFAINCAAHSVSKKYVMPSFPYLNEISLDN